MPLIDHLAAFAAQLARANAESQKRLAEAKHLDALRAAGIPPVLEADALASYRQVRQTALIFDAAFGAPKLNVFAGSRKAYTQPIYCYTCRARYSQDCDCTADDLAASDEEGRCSRRGIDP